MSVPAVSTATERGESPSDPRVVAAVSAALLGAVLGVGQLLLARRFGVLSGADDIVGYDTGTVGEAAIVIWSTAMAVALGAAGPRMVSWRPMRRRQRLTLTSMAVFGALLTAPVAAALASWARMYGGNLSQVRAVWLVVLGVSLGAGLAWAAVRSKSALWSMVCWLVAGWMLLIASSTTAPTSSALVGHLDPGAEWGDASRMFQARLVLVLVAAGIGLLLGAASTAAQWGVPAGRLRVDSLGYVPAPWLAVASGPGLMVLAYCLAAMVLQDFHTAHVTGLVLAGAVGGGGALAGAAVARRVCATENGG